MEEVVCRENMTMAYRRVMLNKGAPGVDGVSVDGLSPLGRVDFVRWRLSLGGLGDSFSFTLHRVRRSMADVVSGYLSMIDDQLPRIVERLRAVQILSRPATDVIQTWDSEESLICRPFLRGHDSAQRSSGRLRLRNVRRRSQGTRVGLARMSKQSRPQRIPFVVVRRTLQRLASRRV